MVQVAGLGYATSESLPLFHALSGGSVVRVVIYSGRPLNFDMCEGFSDVEEVYRLSEEGPPLKDVEPEKLLGLARRWRASGVVLETSYHKDPTLSEAVGAARRAGLKVGLRTPAIEGDLPRVDFLLVDYFRHCSGNYSYSGIDLDALLRLAKENDAWVEVNTYVEKPRAEDVMGEVSITASYGFPIHVHLLDHEGGGPVRHMYDVLRKANPYVYIHVDLYEQLNTYCPRCGSPVAYREGATLRSLELRDGTKCWRCGLELPFRFVVSNKTSAQALALSGRGTRWYDPRAVII
jgi:hypothetical protein